MATTTPNYGWPVPTSTDLVKDGAVAIESLGDAADATMATMVPKSIVDAKGDIIAATAADTVSRLAVGANNTVLTADSSTATGLKWAAAAGGGKVLQVVQGTTTTNVVSNSSAFADTTLTASITPSATSSKILVLISHPATAKSNGNASSRVGFKLFRNSTEIAYFSEYGAFTNSALTWIGSYSFNYLDSPSTSSSTTYKTQFNNGQNVAEVSVQHADRISSIILMEIGA